MVYYFKARPEAGDYTIFMSLDNHENEELFKYGFPEDVWFHVDEMPSAHVFLRLHKGQTFDDIPEGVLEDCAQLVKANSIEGNEVNNIDVVYTPWHNLKKTASMDVGHVGFHNSKMVRIVKVEKRINEIVNRLNRTKVERKPDLKAEREAVNVVENAEAEPTVDDHFDNYTKYIDAIEKVEKAILERIEKLETQIIKEMKATETSIRKDLNQISSTGKRRFHVEWARLLLNAAAIGGTFFMLSVAGRNANRMMRDVGEYGKKTMDAVVDSINEVKTKKLQLVKGPLFSLW
ncbi:uncharacterized protein [Coffea arabica]|uniref:Coiled-coil domain-containing protein 25-like n=1 Tax=Coffea arabica TaxID=13443 RepID=A0A6P6TSA5_COFAR|nr:coiled-coil domain-containing protein 25-like [Coffea arabica]